MTSLLASVAALRRFARHGSASRVHAASRSDSDADSDACEVCAAPIGATHEHLFEIERRTLVCACGSCGLVGATPGTRRIVPRAQRLLGFCMTDAEWAGLGVPVGLAFFYTRQDQDGVTRSVHAVYPGAAGAMDATVDASAWAALAAANPLVGALADDVEALLVNRLRERRDVYAVSIDACFRLVGAMRSTTGEAAVDAFFTSLESSQ